MFFNGMWICKCGETDCPYTESGYSPKKQESPRLVVPVWRADLSACGSSSTDGPGTQRQANKVTYLSSYENGERELCVVTVGARPDSNSSQFPRVSGPVLGRSQAQSQPPCVPGPVPGRTQAQSVSSTSKPATSSQCESKAPARQQQSVADRSLRKSQTKELARSFQIKGPGSGRQQ
jgi:hypothetical protein